MFNSKRLLIVIIIIVAVTLLMIGIGMVGYFYNQPAAITSLTNQKKITNLNSFSTSAEFSTYLSRSNQESTYSPFFNVDSDNKKISPNQFSIEQTSDNLKIETSTNHIKAFDTVDQNNPKELWSTQLSEKSSITSIFFYNYRLYLITKTNVDQLSSCPLDLFLDKANVPEIACPEIYHSENYIPSDAIFSLIVINPVSGQLLKEIFFVGSYYDSEVFFQDNYLFFSQTTTAPVLQYFLIFMQEDGKDILPEDTVEKIRQLANYNLSENSKINELNLILDVYASSLSLEQRRIFEEQMAKKVKKYWLHHQSEIYKTVLVKIDPINLSINDISEKSGKLYYSE